MKHKSNNYNIILSWYSKTYIIHTIIYLLYHNTVYDIPHFIRMCRTVLIPTTGVCNNIYKGLNSQHVLVHRSLLIIYYITINFISFFSTMLPCWLVIEKHMVIVSQQRAYIRIKYSLKVTMGEGVDVYRWIFFITQFIVIIFITAVMLLFLYTSIMVLRSVCMRGVCISVRAI